MLIFKRQGNVLGEYGLLLGLLGLASIGALSAFGTSVDGLFRPFATSCPAQLCDLVNLNFGPVQAASQNAKTLPAVAGFSATTAILPSMQPTQLISTPTLQVLTDNSSAGTNATSVDGSQHKAGFDAVRATWLRAQKLSELAQATTDTALKNYLTVLANDAYWLSGAQANYEYHGSGNTALKDLATTVDNAEVNINTTLATIKGWGNTLQMDFDRLSQDTSISPQNKALALQLASEVLEQSKGRYAASYNQVPDTSERLKITDSFEQLKTVALQTLASGQADDAVAVKASIQNGSELSSPSTP